MKTPVKTPSSRKRKRKEKKTIKGAYQLSDKTLGLKK